MPSQSHYFFLAGRFRMGVFVFCLTTRACFFGPDFFDGGVFFLAGAGRFGLRVLAFCFWPRVYFFGPDFFDGRVFFLAGADLFLVEDVSTVRATFGRRRPSSTRGFDLLLEGLLFARPLPLRSDDSRAGCDCLLDVAIFFSRVVITSVWVVDSASASNCPILNSCIQVLIIWIFGLLPVFLNNARALRYMRLARTNSPPLWYSLPRFP